RNREEIRQPDARSVGDATSERLREFLPPHAEGRARTANRTIASERRHSSSECGGFRARGGWISSASRWELAGSGTGGFGGYRARRRTTHPDMAAGTIRPARGDSLHVFCHTLAGIRGAHVRSPSPGPWFSGSQERATVHLRLHVGGEQIRSSCPAQYGCAALFPRWRGVAAIG